MLKINTCSKVYVHAIRFVCPRFLKPAKDFQWPFAPPFLYPLNNFVGSPERVFKLPRRYGTKPPDAARTRPVQIYDIMHENVSTNWEIENSTRKYTQENWWGLPRPCFELWVELNPNKVRVTRKLQYLHTATAFISTNKVKASCFKLVNHIRIHLHIPR